MLTESELLESLLDLFATLGLLADFFVEQIADVDVLPMEVLCDLRGRLALRRARHSDEENSPHWKKLAS